jgi:hypothetical protein
VNLKVSTSFIIVAGLLNTKRTNNPMNKCTNELTRQFSKEIQMTTKYLKKISTSLAIKEMKIKASLRFHLTHQNGCHQETTNAGKDWGRWEEQPSYTVGGNVN